MIEKIKINDIPPYLSGEQVIKAKHINFLFGLNGSGKTTISRYIRHWEHLSYNKCSIEWDSAPIECSVYNRDYVEENFSESSIPGIFTLGEENIEIKKKIEEYQSDIGSLKGRCSELQRQLDGSIENGLSSQLHTLESSYTNRFWEEKQQLDRDNSPLRFALEGVRGSKEVFKKKLLSEYSSNTEELVDKSELEQLCTQLYNDKAEKCSIIQIPDFKSLYSLEISSILETVVVGKDDVDISHLIKKLGNDGWFRQGVSYIENSEGLCPFCQRPLEEAFLDKIKEYFDETYIAAIKELDRVYTEYIRASDKLISEIKAILESSPEFIDLEKLDAIYQQLKIIIDKNIRCLQDKKESPNIVIHLDSIKEFARSAVDILTVANQKIAKYNKRIDNIKNERAAMTSKVWRYILNILNKEIEIYKKEKEKLIKNIRSIEIEKKSIAQQISDKLQQLHTLEQRLTSIAPIANGINKLLKNYGFNGFYLKVDDNEKRYQFIRENGELAFSSLSEGERNFVTFLYFMYSLQGNTDESGHNSDKVVIIDDPVSSLDNDVLFIVSSLIRDLFQKIYMGEGTIKQLFILSHNIFFFKEVSYEYGLKKEKTGYWLIVKNNDTSVIMEHKKNPVSSTYEMLWDEVRSAQDDPVKSSTLSLANTMRRIIEHYFKLLGGMNLNKLHLEFPDGERQIFKSLISWANAGSHSVFDDYSATPNLYNSEKFLKVFKDLFDKTGHIAHYNMMMKLTAEENEDG